MPARQSELPSFAIATRAFERWLGHQTKLDRNDLLHKRTAMHASPFAFLRATFYRWAQQFETLPRALTNAPRVLAVGDLHVENFGTWRDALGRLAWGINDFDEAYPLAYTNDLVRLAASVVVIIDDECLGLRRRTACQAILDGYRAGLAVGGRPFIIGDRHRWLRPILVSPQRDPGRFWDKLHNLPKHRGAVPAAARNALRRVMPDSRIKFEIHHRVAGLGSLGKMRFTALADWRGGPVAREAKALTCSAAAWARGNRDRPQYAKILARSIRAPDPYLAVQGAWVTRRLAPDCFRIEMPLLARVKDELMLLHAMGFETANVHLGTPGAAKRILRHLNDLPKSWLKEAARNMCTLLRSDYGRFVLTHESR